MTNCHSSNESVTRIESAVNQPSPSSPSSLSSLSSPSGLPAKYQRPKNRRAGMLDRTPKHEKSLDTLIQLVQEYLYLPDPAPFVLVVGAVIANLMPGAPVWLMFVGAPSSGKSEYLNMIVDVPGVIETASISEAGFLSASEKQSDDATGGLLRQFGERPGIMVAKDFTTVMEMSPNDRGKVLAALRELYDGRWVRHVGTSGGHEIAWEGKLGFIGGVTESIDAKHPIIASLGDRFTYFRPEAQPRRLIIKKVLGRNGTSENSRNKLRSKVTEFISKIQSQFPKHPPALSEEDQEWLEITADITASARSAIERDNYGREIVSVPSPESPGRLAGSMGQLYMALGLIGCSRDEARRLIRDVALSCIPRARSRVLVKLIGQRDGLTIEEMREDSNIIHPYTAVQRALTEMECLKVVVRIKGSNLKPDLWRIHPEFSPLLDLI